MRVHKIKLFIGFFILLIYVSIGVFGLFKLDHTTAMHIEDCPYVQNGYAICKDVLSHINNWRQFSNATFLSLFIFSCLFLGIVLSFFGKQNFLNQKQYFYKWKYYLDNIKFYNPLYAVVRWLSLFENSPPVFKQAFF